MSRYLRHGDLRLVWSPFLWAELSTRTRRTTPFYPQIKIKGVQIKIKGLQIKMSPYFNFMSRDFNLKSSYFNLNSFYFNLRVKRCSPILLRVLAMFPPRENRQSIRMATDVTVLRRPLMADLAAAVAAGLRQRPPPLRLVGRSPKCPLTLTRPPAARISPSNPPPQPPVTPSLAGGH